VSIKGSESIDSDRFRAAESCYGAPKGSGSVNVQESWLAQEWSQSVLMVLAILWHTLETVKG